VQLLVLYGNLLGSAVSGWIHWIWWLVVPPIIYAIFAFSTTASIERQKQHYGDDSRTFSRSMLKPNFFLIAWNTILNGAIFGVVWAVSSFLTGS
jgi:hypothetical protein